MHEFIQIVGATGNNLKNVTLNIPKNKLVAMTGISGSGKSTLAFDTLQCECQRLYMESLGMATDLLPKAKVEKIIGLSPSISVEQYSGNMNPRSTVGTVTGVLGFLRLLFATAGGSPCLKCGARLPERAPDQEGWHCLECGQAVPALTKRSFSFNTPEGACPSCLGLGVANEPNLALLIDEEKSIPQGGVTGWDSAYMSRYGEALVNAGKHYGFEFDLNTPIREYSDVQRALLLYGVESPEFTRYFPTVKPPGTVPKGKFEGVVTNLKRRFSEQQSGGTRLERFFSSRTCPECGGQKLNERSRQVTFGGKNIIEVSHLDLQELQAWLVQASSVLPAQVGEVVAPIIEAILERVGRLVEIGIGYLSLERVAASLSPGELQRIRLAGLLGTGLTGVLYVLDEPTTGLHPTDVGRLIGLLRALRDMGNTCLVVEHDPDFIEAADYIIDMGPGAGCWGGSVVAAGRPRQVSEDPQSVTGKYLFQGSEGLGVAPRREGKGSIHIRGAVAHNLKGIDVEIPLGRLVCVAGVSGAGKSSLVFDVLYRYIQEGRAECQEITGLGQLSEVLVIDQSSLGRSSRSNAATYTGVFTHIRDFYANLPEARSKGLRAQDFSFNVEGGRCERCQGAGILSVPMHFMPDVQVTCPDCQGKRFKGHVLEVRYQQLTIADLLSLSIEEAHSLFAKERQIAQRLDVLIQVGLGYLSLGQPASTLSGGEAQRVKLAKELGGAGRSNALYLLDEPTTGLHPADVQRLITLLGRIVEQGNTVVAIEHDSQFLWASDWIIDLGYGGGRDGGRVVALGTPESLLAKPVSPTGQSLYAKWGAGIGCNE